MNLDEMVNLFLTWPLPESVCSDLVATRRGYPNRTGTTLLTAREAKLMLEHVLTEYRKHETKSLSALVERVGQFDAAIRRIAEHVGACCGGVDTGPNGGHTAEAIIEAIDRKLATSTRVSATTSTRAYG